MRDSYQCSVSVLPASDELVIKSNVVNWQDYHIQLIIGHPRIKQLDLRINRAKAAKDYKALNMWNDDMTRMLKLLVGYAASAELVRLGNLQKYTQWVLTALFVCSTLLYAVLPLPAAIGIDILLVGALYFVIAVFFPARINYLHDVMAMGFRRSTGTPMGVRTNA